MSHTLTLQKIISFHLQGGTNLIINSLGPVQPGTEKKEKWFSFSNNVKKDSKIVQVRVRNISPIFWNCLQQFVALISYPVFIDTTLSSGL